MYPPRSYGSASAPNTQRNYLARGAYSWCGLAARARRLLAIRSSIAEEWVPRPSKPRMKVWTHTERLAALAEMHGPPKAAIALMIGSGMELSALLRLRAKDVSDDGSRTALADGTKTEYRSRHVTVDAWAWEFFVANAPGVVGTTKVFP
jgi:integrase